MRANDEVRTTTLSSKGQVTIPAAFLRDLELEPGTKLLVVRVRRGLMLVPEDAADELGGTLPGVFGDARAFIEDERSEWS